MKTDRNKIVKYCEDFLLVKNFKDYCVNGLQVEGAKEIAKIITGVSLSKRLIDSAIEKQAEMIIVHHGIFKDMIASPPQIKGVMKERLKLMLNHDINLMGFHLPLDAHKEIGNNISLLRLFDLKKEGVISSPEYGDIGFIGSLPEAIEFDEFVRIVNEKLKTKSITITGKEKMVKKVGIISGGASPDFETVAELGADTFICGDIRENIVRGVEEIGINFINAGHYNTEKLGVQNLGELLHKVFKVEVEFVDIPNDV